MLQYNIYVGSLLRARQFIPKVQQKTQKFYRCVYARTYTMLFYCCHCTIEPRGCFATRTRRQFVRRVISLLQYHWYARDIRGRRRLSILNVYKYYYFFFFIDKNALSFLFFARLHESCVKFEFLPKDVLCICSYDG